MTMANKQLENIELKLQALDEAISYPPYKEVEDAPVIEVDKFDYTVISEKISSNEKLTNLEGAKIDLLLEVIKILSDNVIKFNIELHNYMGFYWRGLPILVVKINGESMNLMRMMYISVKVYKDELTDALADKQVTKSLFRGIGAVILLGGLIFGYIIMKNKASE